MYCNYCNSQIHDGATVCPACGNAVNSFPVQAARKYPPVKKARFKLLSVSIVYIALIVFGIASIIFGSLQAKSSPIVEPGEYNASSEIGDYVKTDLIGVIPVSEIDTKKGSATVGVHYICYAVNSDFERFLIYVNKNEYEMLSPIIFDSSLYESFGFFGSEPITICADVRSINSTFRREAANNPSFNDVMAMVPDYQLTVTTAERHAESGDGWFTGGAICLFVSLFVLLFGVIKSLNKYRTVRDAYYDYGDVEQIYTSVCMYRTYADYSIVTNGDYIISTRDHCQMVRAGEVLCLYQYIHKTNFRVDGVALIAVNRYGEKIRFDYAIGETKENMSKIIFYLKQFCPNAAVGYSKEAQNYIAQRKITRK